jgi:hypothetical protein
MTITLGVWVVPVVLTIISWAWAYLQDRRDPFLGQLWSYHALGVTVSSWLFYGLLWLIL